MHLRFGWVKTKAFYRNVLIGILLLSAFLRLYNYPLRYNLGSETVRDAAIGIVGARQLQAPLTGSFSSLGPFTFGPWYAYQLIIATIIFRTLYAPWIYLTLISIATVFVAYKIGELMLGKPFGLLLAFLFAISPAQIISATHLTSHNMTNIFAVLSLYIFMKILLKNISYWWGYFLGLFIGIGINLHYQMSGLMIFPLIILLYKPKRYKYFLSAISGVGTAFIPLLIFELNNHWFNTRNMLYYLRVDKYLMYVPNSWTLYVRDFWPAFWADTFGVPIYFAIILIGVFAVSAFLAYTHKKISVVMALVFMAFLVNFILLRYYWGHRFFGYLNFLRPFVFIFTGYGIFSLSKIRFGKILALAIIALIFGFSWQRNIFTLRKDDYSVSIYNEVNSFEKLYPDTKFNIYSCGFNGSYVPGLYSYIFALDKDNRISLKGKPIGVLSPDCASYDHLAIGNSNFVDLSGIERETLAKDGWNTESLETIYESSARWWFKLQP